MDVVQGRKDSSIILPDGRVLPPLAFGWIMEGFKFYDHIDQYRLVQKRVDSFRLLVKRNSLEVDEEIMAAELLNHVRTMLKVDESDVAFEVEFVDDVPLDKSGKLRKIVSEVEQ